MTVWDGRVDPRDKARSMIAIRSAHEHAVRRKRWNRAFSTASVKSYEPIIVKRALQLIDELSKLTSTSKTSDDVVDLSKWLSFFTSVLYASAWVAFSYLNRVSRVDFMGDMAYVTPFLASITL